MPLSDQDHKNFSTWSSFPIKRLKREGSRGSELCASSVHFNLRNTASGLQGSLHTLTNYFLE